MYTEYWVFFQKIGTKSMCGKPKMIHAENGKVRFGKYKGEDVQKTIAAIVKDLQDSGIYYRIAVKDTNKRGYIYDWHMPIDESEAQKTVHAEYMQKREALKEQIKAYKEQIKALEAQVTELDEKWLRG